MVFVVVYVTLSFLTPSHSFGSLIIWAVCMRIEVILGVRIYVVVLAFGYYFGWLLTCVYNERNPLRDYTHKEPPNCFYSNLMFIFRFSSFTCIHSFIQFTLCCCCFFSYIDLKRCLKQAFVYRFCLQLCVLCALLKSKSVTVRKVSWSVSPSLLFTSRLSIEVHCFEHHRSGFHINLK